MIKALILLTLLSFQPHYQDRETWEEREARMTQLAEDITYAVDVATCTDQPKDCKRSWPLDRKSLAMALVTQAKHESDLAAHIHRNECDLKKGECDARRELTPGTGEVRYIQQSFSLWQMKKFNDIPEKDWEQISAGISGTRVAALYAAKRLGSHYRGCQETLAGAFSRYATGNSCYWARAGERVATWETLMRKSTSELEGSKNRRKEKMVH